MAAASRQRNKKDTRAVVDELVNAFTSGEDMEPASLEHTIKSTLTDARRTIDKIGDVVDALRLPVSEIKDTARSIHNNVVPSAVRAIDGINETNEDVRVVVRTVRSFTRPILILITVGILLLIACGLWYLTRSVSTWYEGRSRRRITSDDTGHSALATGAGGPSAYLQYSRDSGNSLAAALLSSSDSSSSHSIDNLAQSSSSSSSLLSSGQASEYR